MTVPSTIRRYGEERSKHVVIERKSNLGNNWVPVTWHQLIEEVRSLARGFIAMGVQPGDCIAIIPHVIRMDAVRLCDSIRGRPRYPDL